MISNQKSEYGKLLTKLIKDREMTQADFYNKLGIKKPYFYDIIGGKVNPPPAETQIKILNILNPKEEDRKMLLDIAAKVREELPADILLYFDENKKIVDFIRKKEDYKKIIGGIMYGKEKN